MKKFKIDVYGQTVLLFESKKDLEKWQEKNLVEDPENLKAEIAMSAGMAGVMCMQDGGVHWFIYLEEKNLVTLCHESCHLAYLILDMVGVIHTSENHEMLAYLQDYIFGKCANLMKLPVIFE
jgi:hypothetical protein